MSTAAISAATFVAVLAASGDVRAQSAEAEALFNEGDALMKKGQVAKACDAFEGSNKLEPRAGTLIRLGECREKNGQLASAWSAYKDALTRVKDEKKKKIASARVLDIEPRLSHLTINVPDSARVEGLEITRNGAPFDEVLWGHAVPVNGGEYKIYARALDHGEWSRTIKIANEHADVEIEVPKLDTVRKKSIVVTPPPETEKADGATEPGAGLHKRFEPTKLQRTDGATVGAKPVSDDEPVDRSSESPSTFTGTRKVAVVLGALAVGAGVTGLVFGKTAKSNEKSAFELCPDPTYPCSSGDLANAKLSRARTQATTANVTLIAGGGLLLTAVVLWFIGHPDSASTDVAVVPHVGSDSTGLALGGRF